MSTNKFAAKNTIQKYCKVCHDTGKSEAEYRSHYTRETKDPNSKILCPTLLAMECRYCFKKGHTVKYCSVIKENEKKDQRKNNNRNSNKVQENMEPLKKITNKFAELSSDNEEEEEEKEANELKEYNSEFPVIFNNINITSKVKTAINYKAALETECFQRPLTIKPIIPPLTHKGKPMKALAELDWAALSDSEDEDEKQECGLYDDDSHIDRVKAWCYADKYDKDW